MVGQSPGIRKFPVFFITELPAINIAFTTAVFLPLKI
jgi:hypothetical protein